MLKVLVYGVWIIIIIFFEIEIIIKVTTWSKHDFRILEIEGDTYFVLCKKRHLID